MTRLQRLGSSFVFLLWGCLLLGLWLLTSYLTFGVGLLPRESALVGAILFGLAVLTGIGFLGGFYLLVRVFI